MYPILKPSVRLKRFSKYCWLYAPQVGIDAPIPAYASFILTLMDGRWSVDDLVSIVGDVYHSDKRVCRELVQMILKEYHACIELQQDSRQVELRYDPQDFLFNGSLASEDEQERLETPNLLAMSLTRACNFKCIYCFNASEKPYENELSGDEWCDVVEQAQQLGVFQVLVTGGEPTVHPEFTKILRKLNTSDMDFKLFTNGAYLTDEILDLLAGSSVQVSLDTADRDIHKQLTGADTFPKVTENMARLIKRGIPVSVKSVITTLNQDGTERLYHLCDNMGVDLLSIDKFDVSSSGRGDLDLRISDTQKQLLIESISNIKTNRTHLNINLQKDVWTKPDDAIGCGAFRSSMILSGCGDLIGCEKIIDVPSMTIGNIRENSLEDLWNSPKIDEFLRNIRSTADTKCQNCSTFEKCRTGCFAMKHYFGKPSFGADPRCEIETDAS